MKTIFLLSIMALFFFNACQINKKTKEPQIINSVNLNANHILNNEFKLVYNSIDTISTTFFINKKIIEKSKVNSVLDTLKIENYKINVDKQKRTIEFTRK